MTGLERRGVVAVGGIFAFRMLGLFMILPVFALYADQYVGMTPVLMGVALGVYGLSQAVLQIPFGRLSDRFGRKPVITVGLILFAIGSVVAALSHSIYGLILGRCLQGAGAVGSTLLALVADLTREDQRTKAMAVIGMTIGLSFSVAMVCGPLISASWGLAGIFWITAGLALLGLVLLWGMVPPPEHSGFHAETEVEPTKFRAILSNVELLRLDLGIFFSHAILTASFVALPVSLSHLAHIPERQQWIVYLPILILSFFAMLPFIIIAEKKRQMKRVFLGAILTMAIAQGILAFNHTSIYFIAFALFFFFGAFSLLEACLPSLVSKTAPRDSKGTAMGVYSCSQFLGIFVGGILGGWLFGHADLQWIYLAAGTLAVVWFFVAFRMREAAPSLRGA